MLLMVKYLVHGSFSRPFGIAFDLSGNVHVGGHGSSSVTVFTPSGQFVRQYDKTHTNRPTGIAIDPSGYSLVNNYSNGTLSIFDPDGKFMHLVGGFRVNMEYQYHLMDQYGWLIDTTTDL